MDILLFYEWWEKDELLSWECLASIAWKCLIMPLMVSEQIAASARMKLGGIRAKTGLGYFRQTGPIVLTKQIHYRATEGLHPALRWDLLPLLEHDRFLWQPKADVCISVGEESIQLTASRPASCADISEVLRKAENGQSHCSSKDCVQFCKLVLYWGGLIFSSQLR